MGIRPIGSGRMVECGSRIARKREKYRYRANNYAHSGSYVMTTFHETIAQDLGNALAIIKFVREGHLELTALTDAERRIKMALRKSMAVKLYIDDERDLPESYAKAGYRLVRSGEVAIERIKYLGLENVTHISFDHDLGDGVLSGYDVAKYIEERVIVHGDPIPEMDVHSQNPPGARNIIAAIQSMQRFTEKKGIADSSN